MIPSVVMDPQVAASIRKTFRKPKSGVSPRAERCGILAGVFDGQTFFVNGWFEVKNSAKAPTKTFSMTAGDVRAAAKRRKITEADIIGSIHTHPRKQDREVSVPDVMEQPNLTLGCMYHPHTDTFVYYTYEFGFIGREAFDE